MEIISVTVISSSDASEEVPSGKGFSPEVFSTTLKVRKFHETTFRDFPFFGKFGKVWNHKIFHLVGLAKVNSRKNV